MDPNVEQHLKALRGNHWINASHARYLPRQLESQLEGTAGHRQRQWGPSKSGTRWLRLEGWGKIHDLTILLISLNKENWHGDARPRSWRGRKLGQKPADAVHTDKWGNIGLSTEFKTHSKGYQDRQLQAREGFPSLGTARQEQEDKSSLILRHSARVSFLTTCMSYAVKRT